MLDLEISEEQLALLVQASRQFAFEQMARGERLLPFATRVMPDGEIEFARFAEPDTDQPLDAIYALTQATMAKEAKDSEIVATALVAAVEIQAPDSDYSQAIRIHIEAPGFVRQILAPYAVVPAADGSAQASLDLGAMVPVAAEAQVFTG